MLERSSQLSGDPEELVLIATWRFLLWVHPLEPFPRRLIRGDEI